MEEYTNDDMLHLGGNIQLSGFKDMDRAQIVVLKKIVGTHVRRYSEICKKFEGLVLTMKPVHQTESSAIYELHARCIDNGKQIISESSDRNLFFALDNVLKRIESEIQK